MTQTAVLHIVAASLVLGGALAQQPGGCPAFSHYSSILFTPEVMLDLVNRGETFLMATAGVPVDPNQVCQTLTFHRQQTWSYAFRDRSGIKKILTGTYSVVFPTFTQTASIEMTGLSDRVLGSGRSGNVALAPLAYAHGVMLMGTCSEFLWTRNEQFYIFMDSSVNLTDHIDYKRLMKELNTAGIIHEELIEPNLVDQTCSTCRRAEGQCTIPFDPLSGTSNS